METKGRRAPRSAGLIAGPAEPAEPLAAPAATAEPSTEPLDAAELPAEAAAPAATALEVATAAAGSISQPSIVPAASALASNRTTPDDIAFFNREALSALAQSQAALTRGLGALSAEMAGLALSGIDAAARTATRMLGVKTLSDAIEVNAGFTCGSLNTLVDGSVKLSELGVKLATETSQPILSQLGRRWIAAGHRRS
jgi:Phasin protein